MTEGERRTLLRIALGTAVEERREVRFRHGKTGEIVTELTDGHDWREWFEEERRVAATPWEKC